VKEEVVSGRIIWGSEMEVVEGSLLLRDGWIRGFWEEKTDGGLVVAPCFVNAHTHLGDSVCKDPVFSSLEELVRPPDGFKHRLLEETPPDRLVEGMRLSLLDMVQTGTCAFADFREGGRWGVRLLWKALDGIDVEPLILGRPLGCDDFSGVLEFSHGFGLSSTRDLDPDLLAGAVEAVRRKGKFFAIHAGETCVDDIWDALDFEPDFLVHLVRAGMRELRAVSRAGVGVVVCPRSNLVTGVGLPRVREMLELGIRVGVGTDNVMLNSVNMFSEMEFLVKVLGLDDRQVFKMCTLNGAEILGKSDLGCIQEGKRARLMILDGRSPNLRGARDILKSIVRRGRPTDILRVMG